MSNEPEIPCIEFIKRAPGQFALYGELSFFTVTDALLKASRLFNKQESQLVIDLSGLTRVDSAGLAVLLEWMVLARAESQQIRFANLPGQLLGIARVSGVDRLLLHNNS